MSRFGILCEQLAEGLRASLGGSYPDSGRSQRSSLPPRSPPVEQNPYQSLLTLLEPLHLTHGTYLNSLENCLYQVFCQRVAIERQLRY